MTRLTFSPMRSIPLESAVWYNKCVDLLTVSVTARESAGEPYTLVEIVGEADVTNTDELRRLLDEEVSQQPRTLIIDLSGLRFMDSSALHALLRVNRSTGPAGRRPRPGFPAGRGGQNPAADHR